MPTTDATEVGVAWDVISAVTRTLADLGVATAVEAQVIVSSARSNRLLDEAAATLRDDALGLTLAARIPIGALGILDYAFCSSPSMRDALRRITRHFRVVSQRMALSLVERPPDASLLLERNPGVTYSRHWIEFTYAMIVTRMRQTLGRAFALHAVQFAHAAPADARSHHAFFATPVLFGRPTDRIDFDVELLDQPLVTAAAQLGQFLETMIQEQQGTTTDPLVDRVRRVMIPMLEAGEPRIEEVATKLGLSARSLQRELRTHHTTHSVILDEVRRERASRLLEDSAVTVGEVARRLGFAEQSSFFRAYRRWTGKSPRARPDRAG